jgi:hypothetical protein
MKVKFLDWYFDECPTDELAACARYEYCRESAPMRQAVEQLREWQPVQLPQIDWQKASKAEWEAFWRAGPKLLIPSFRFDYFCGVSGFPEVPWLAVPPKERKDYVRTEREIVALRPAVTFRLPDPTSDWASWEATRPQGTLCGWWSIRPGFKKDELIEQFKAQLTTILSQSVVKTKPNRGGSRDMLRGLGAWRLLHGGLKPARATKKCVDELKQYSHSRTDSKQLKPPYSSHTAWTKARDRAGALLKEIDRRAEDIADLLRAAKID